MYVYVYVCRVKVINKSSVTYNKKKMRKVLKQRKKNKTYPQ